MFWWVKSKSINGFGSKVSKVPKCSCLEWNLLPGFDVSFHQTFQVPKMEESSPIYALWIRLICRENATPKWPCEVQYLHFRYLKLLVIFGVLSKLNDYRSLQRVTVRWVIWPWRMRRAEHVFGPTWNEGDWTKCLKSQSIQISTIYMHHCVLKVWINVCVYIIDVYYIYICLSILYVHKNPFNSLNKFKPPIFVWLHIVNWTTSDHPLKDVSR